MINRGKAEIIPIVRRRLIIILVGITLVALSITGRLIQLSLGEIQEDPFIPSPVPKRADIVDRNNKLLATDLMTYSVYANPSRLQNTAETTRALCKVLEQKQCIAVKNRLKSDKHFVWIARHLTPKQFYEINYLGIPSLESFYEPKRIYPQANLAAHLIGYTDTDRHGLSGVESAYNNRLENSSTPLVLSIDTRIQNITMQALKFAIEKHSAIAGMAVVSSVKHGDVLAMASYPDFDLNRIQHASDDERFNRPMTGIYEMGSTMKTFSIATALDVGAIKMTDTFPVGEPFKIGRFSITDFKPKKGNMTATEVMIHSSNIGTAHIISHVAGNIQRSYLQNLGILDPSPIPFAEIGKPLLPSNWSEVYRTTVAFGHGISISVMQLIQAFSTVVNDGVAVQLQFEKTVGPMTGKQVIKPETSKLMRDMLRAVVASGTGGKAEVAGYEVGGKTGTAEKITGRGYNHSKRISSFISAYPMSDPEVVIYVMLDEPMPTKDTFGYATGGWVAAPVVGKIVSQASPFIGIFPQKVIQNTADTINSQDVSDEDITPPITEEQ